MYFIFQTRVFFQESHKKARKRKTLLRWMFWLAWSSDKCLEESLMINNRRLLMAMSAVIFSAQLVVWIINDNYAIHDSSWQWVREDLVWIINWCFIDQWSINKLLTMAMTDGGLEFCMFPVWFTNNQYYHEWSMTARQWGLEDFDFEYIKYESPMSVWTTFCKISSGTPH